MRNKKIAELLHEYFELGVAEGREGRNHDTEAGDAQRVLSEIEAEIAALSAAEPVSSIVPDHCSGTALIFEGGCLHVRKDGSGHIVVDEDDFKLEDDRCEGEHGSEGSVHWIARFPAGEMTALRNFLNGQDFPAPPAPSSARPQCCMCGKKGLSTVEGDGGTECELSDGRWVCSSECYDRAVEPAPSVAVKALADAYKAGFDASSQGYNGEVFPEYEADNEWLAQRDSDLSALSAQVQDVAGWQSMDTAPKDGSEFAAGRRYSPDGEFVVHTYRWVGPPNYWNSKRNGVCIRPSYQDDYMWCPLPAAPAKQEG